MAETFYDKVTQKFGISASEKDSSLLATYIARFQTDKGIHLPRHRYLVVAVKAS